MCVHHPLIVIIITAQTIHAADESSKAMSCGALFIQSQGLLCAITTQSSTVLTNHRADGVFHQARQDFDRQAGGCLVCQGRGVTREKHNIPQAYPPAQTTALPAATAVLC